MRTFETGATRDSDQDKYDYEGFLSPAVIERFASYMHQHRIQADGNLRDSDNWQKGIPKDQYMKSLWRHFMSLWKHHRGLPADESLEEALCALLFNVQGYFHEELKDAQRCCEKEALKLDNLRQMANDLMRTAPAPICTTCGGQGQFHSTWCEGES